MNGILIALLLLSENAGAKAQFLNRNRMIGASDVIAIVDVVKLEKVDPNVQCGEELATAVVKEYLKGRGKGDMLFLAPCFFPCAVTKMEKGPQIVFLKNTQFGFIPLAGSNWNYSYRPIREAQVEWYLNDNDLRMGRRPLPEVVAEIAKVISSQGASKKIGK
jgi:hypothetical protein